MRSIKLCSLLLCILMLIPLCTACANERFDLLYEIEQNGLTFCVRGKDGQVRQLVVKEGDKVLWSKGIKTDRRMGKIDNTYGLLVQDLNFDGYDDILIATAKEGDLIVYDAWVRVGAKPQYNRHEELSGRCNTRADARLQAIFTFEKTTEARGDNAYLRTEKATKYLWQDGKLVPDTYAAIHYYSDGERTPYCYSVAYYDEELGRFLDSSDAWLTKEEYESTDWSFLYYFK